MDVFLQGTEGESLRRQRWYAEILAATAPQGLLTTLVLTARRDVGPLLLGQAEFRPILAKPGLIKKLAGWAGTGPSLRFTTRVTSTCLPLRRFTMKLGWFCSLAG